MPRKKIYFTIHIFRATERRTSTEHRVRLKKFAQTENKQRKFKQARTNLRLSNSVLARNRKTSSSLYPVHILYTLRRGRLRPIRFHDILLHASFVILFIRYNKYNVQILGFIF